MEQAQAAELDRQGAEGEDAVEQDREEADQEDDDQLGQVAEAEPGDEQRREGDLGHHLQRHRGRVEGLAQHAREGHGQCQGHADRHRDQEAADGLAAGDQGVFGDARQVAPELVEHGRGRRQDVERHLEQAHGGFPGEEEQRCHHQAKTVSGEQATDAAGGRLAATRSGPQMTP